MKAYYIITIIALSWSVSVCDDVPCAVRQTQFGAVCVCNSSYCDTVERPPPLTRGRYYRYTTSSVRPGFHRTTGYFKHKHPNVVNQTFLFTVNPAIKYQEILGIGGSFTDAVGIVFDSLPHEAQGKFIESYFSDKGIEYTMGRLPIGATDFSTRLYTYDDNPGDDRLDLFSLAEEDYKYKIPLIQKAMNVSRHEIKMVAGSFTAPNWMKMNDTWLVTYIKEKYFDAWAQYHIKFLDAYSENGIKVWTLSGGNEVVLGLFCKCLILGTGAYPHDHLKWFQDYLAPSLAASNHSQVKILIMDDMRVFARPWMSRFALHPESYKLVEGVALHWYLDWYLPDDVNWLLADVFHMEYPDKLYMLTESSINVLFGGEPVELGSWTRGAFYMYSIIQNINHWANGYLDWNLALDPYGGPNLNLPTDAAIITNSSSGEFYKNPIFYGLGHFSKFIPPGARRVHVESNSNRSPQPDISPEAINKMLNESNYLDEFLSKLNHTSLNMPSLLNTGDQPRGLNLTKAVICTATVNPDTSSTVILLNTMDFDVNVTIKDTVSGYITTTLTSNSINTFIYWPNH